MAMAWISFPNLLPTFFVKECLFSIAAVVGKPIQLDQATINKTRPSCARVKVLVNLKGTFPKVVKMNIEDEKTGEVRTTMVEIKYDYVPKYCGECKMQGHDREDCRVLKQSKGKEEHKFQHVNHNIQNTQIMQDTQPKQIPRLQTGKSKVLSSGRVVGNPGNWNVVKDKRIFVNSNKQSPLVVANKFQALVSGETMQADCSTQGNNTNIMSSHQQTNKEDNEKGCNKSTKGWVAKVFCPSLQKEKSPVVSSPGKGKNSSTVNNVPDQQQINKVEQLKGETNVKMTSTEENEKIQITEEVKGEHVIDSCSNNCNNQALPGNPDHGKEVSNSTNICLVDGGEIKQIEYENDRLALVEIPEAMQIDKSQMIRMKSPNRVLHDIVSHNIGETPIAEAAYLNQIAQGITEAEMSDDLLENVSTEADLSPRILKAARKGKKQGNGEHIQSIRVQPKRTRETPKKYQ
uniref:Uncharacterized protein n=1 Tax=Solanum tuberosum TaxID=4113 RepID=M1AZZ6_SOLTU